MDHKLNTLINTTHKLISLIEKYDTYWANWFKDALKDIEHEDLNGIEKILHARGGMGSFNDLYFCPQNGHKIEEKDVEKVNKQKNQMFYEILELAEEIKRDYYKDN